MGGGESKITLLDAGEEFASRLLEAVAGISAGGAAGFAEGEGNQEEKSEIGDQAAGGKGNDSIDRRGVEAAPVGLVGDGRVKETIAKNDLAGGEGGADDLADQLGAAGIDEEELGFGREGASRGVMFEDGADFLADGGSAGFAQRADGFAGGAEAFGQQSDLGGFAGAFGAFKSDEEAAHGVT